jgi:hypothetical protein
LDLTYVPGKVSAGLSVDSLPRALPGVAFFPRKYEDEKMLIAAMKTAMLKNWPIAAAVTAASCLIAHLNVGDLSIPLASSIFAIAAIAVLLVTAPVEYQKAKTRD